ncbi:right-handed parallel beta-helix repeat-containing protein [Paenibacillus beijingensis]|uniref:Uncharacterized protein n=1 Tax=Paenibacillus beijingensis TaxID=1126833 RepID=A0A0D5NIZ5_9BACL|nr:right-handed parallel beta-helix repeat-containing protein [Paenibacillus beijingensis]AJY75339.1 hypothetical protein VN24_13105 [Paenibacillus beijingensis]
MKRTIHASEFGIRPDTMQDVTFQVYRMLSQARTDDELHFEKGRYDFWPHKAFERFYFISNHGNSGLKRCAFPLIGFNNLTIDGGGAEFIFHGVISPFVIEGSSRITLRNFSIDWERPMLSQGELISVESEHFDIYLPEQYPFDVVNDRMIFFGEDWKYELSGWIEMDALTNSPAYQSGDHPFGSRLDAFKAVRVSERVVRFEGEVKRRPRLGNQLILKHGPRLNPGILITDSSNVGIRDVAIYSANGMGVIAQRSGHIDIHAVNVIPNPLTDRRFSVSADAVHIVNCRGEIKLTSCTFRNQMDDPLNIHGIYGKIAQRIDDRTLLVEWAHEEQKGVEIAAAGDWISLVRGDSFAEFGRFRCKDMTTFSKDYMMIQSEAVIPPDIKPGDVIENASWIADLVLKDCTMAGNRARGPLLTASGKVLVENNTINVPGAGIFIEGDAHYWFESGKVNDVTIRNNRFEECTYCPQWGMAVIVISPKITNPSIEGYHRNIHIHDNRFKMFDSNLLKASFVDHLRFENNRIEVSEAYEKHGKMSHIVEVHHCVNVVVSNNKLESGFNNIGLVNGEKVDISLRHPRGGGG